MGLLWTAGGLVTLCLALTLAELSTMFPRPGGNFVFIYESWGPLAAFVYGWTFLFLNPASWAAVAIIGADYFGRFVRLTEFEKRAFAVALIAFITFANYRSMKFATVMQNVTTGVKALALASVAALIFAFAPSAGGAFAAPISFALPRGGGVGIALVSVLWAYEGVANFCALSGEVRNPGHTIPRALIVGVTIVVSLYLLINAAYAFALPVSSIAMSDLVAADAVGKVAGHFAVSIVAALVIISTFGGLAAQGMSDPRVFYAMAQEGLFFRRTGKVHPRYQTPHIAVLVTGGLAALYVSVRTFEQLAAMFILGLWPFYVLAVAGVIRLRIIQPDRERPYRTWGYPLVPLIFIAAALFLLSNSLIVAPLTSLINIGVTLAGIPAFYAWRHFARRISNPPEPVAT